MLTSSPSASAPHRTATAAAAAVEQRAAAAGRGDAAAAAAAAAAAEAAEAAAAEEEAALLAEIREARDALRAPGLAAVAAAAAAARGGFYADALGLFNEGRYCVLLLSIPLLFIPFGAQFPQHFFISLVLGTWALETLFVWIPHALLLLQL